MGMIDVIQKKRDNGVFTTEEIQSVIQGFTADAIPTYQMAALLMAIYLNGLNEDELAAWTDAMLHSGLIMDWSQLDRPTADKHSTGGVGDKISLPLAPAVAACGVAVPMVSGRALGHTGGTLDKLESIPGFDVGVSLEDARRMVSEIGLVLMGQTAEVAPADKRIYALRDAIGTVESIPLIASSIMSKKLAEGVDALVLDVKVGSGAFMKTRERASELAHTLVGIGRRMGCATVAYLTRMDRPLGRLVGNALEVHESVEILRGGGPADIRELTVTLGAEMLVQAGVAEALPDGRRQIESSLDSGEALERFRRLVIAQGGDGRVVDDLSLLPQAAKQVDVVAREAGHIVAIDTEKVGRASMSLGAGREKAEDDIDPAVGLEVLKTVGDEVSVGEPLVRLHVNDEDRVQVAEEWIFGAYQVHDAAPKESELILERI
jgi:pyrimidine-nucleoside phosphorylase